MRQALINFAVFMGWRFQKPPTPYIVDLPLQPGKSTLRMIHPETGEVIAVLILRELRIDHLAGASAEFVDLSHFIEERTLTRVHMPGCTKGLHTVAEGCG